jgi:hypothetical protein
MMRRLWSALLVVRRVNTTHADQEAELVWCSSHIAQIGSGGLRVAVLFFGVSSAQVRNMVVQTDFFHLDIIHAPRRYSPSLRHYEVTSHSAEWELCGWY